MVEVGFGNGIFTAEMAAKRPDCNVLGIERSPGMARQADRKVVRRGIHNVVLIQADAHAIFDYAFPPHTIDEIWLNFPDPWFKRSHNERRLVTGEFIELLSRKSKPNALFHLATDHMDLAEWVEEVLAGQSRFRSIHPTPYVHAIPANRPTATHYETKARAIGSEIRYFEWRHVDPRPDHGPHSEESVVPNVSMNTKIDLAGFFGAFAPKPFHLSGTIDDTVVAYRRIFHALDVDEWLVETTVREGHLQQSFAVVVHRREGDRLTVKTAAWTNPRPTRGVKAAVLTMARHLLTADPTAVVIESTVGPVRPLPSTTETIPPLTE